MAASNRFSAPVRTSFIPVPGVLPTPIFRPERPIRLSQRIIRTLEPDGRICLEYR